MIEEILQQRNFVDDASHLHRPINQFRLIQRFRSFWPKVQEIFDDEDIVSKTPLEQLEPGIQSFWNKGRVGSQTMIVGRTLTRKINKNSGTIFK